MFNRKFKLVLMCVALIIPGYQISASTSALPKHNAQTILEKADKIRFPDSGFQVDVKIESEKPGRDPDNRAYRVLSRDNDNTLIMTMRPVIDRGQILLMKERDLWLFMPEVSQPVRLPLSQRLTGEVANGDLARARFSSDYSAQLVSTESIDNENYFVLELNANSKRVTYRRIMFWVHEENFRPYKAEFYTVSDRLLKTCFYQEFKPILGELRPTKLLILDALRKGNQSILSYSEMKIRNLPDKVFTKQYLKKLQ